jgi:eukaryotic-like serine/threonine-protein kinase
VPGEGEAPQNPIDRLKTGGAARLAAGLGSDARARRELLLGRVLSGYELFEHIADGGMSQVYRARRADGRFERDVAVKVSVGGVLDAALRERFFQEQQILAGLNHPAISQLYDAGISEEGWPYIVMELIDGLPLDQHCAGVDLAKKVALLAKVCSALSFAHGHLVVHRDIKPSNVLVTSEGQPKLLDFGIAKMLSASGDITQVPSLTPRYASPEQLLGRPASVASDVYQAGLLLADVLDPGLIPREPGLESAIRRASDGVDPALNRASRARLPGELVSVIEQCLRAEPAERYAEVSAIREDLERYLGGYPVRAVGNGKVYRARKFAQRNAVPLAAAGLVVVAFVASGGWYLAAVNEARHRAELEADTARAVTEFLVDIFNAPDPAIAQGRAVTAEDLLRQGLAEVEQNDALAPLVEARLYATIGKANSQLGLNAQAEPVLRQAVALHRQLSPSGWDTLSSQNNLASTLRNLGRFEEAVAVAEDALARHEQSHPEDDSLRLDLISNLAVSHQQWGNLAVAENYYRRGDRWIERHGIESEGTRAWYYVSYGHLLNLQGRGEAGERLLRPVRDDILQNLGPDHPAALAVATNLGHSLHLQGRFREAFPLFESIYRGRVRTLGEDHMETLGALANVGSLHISLEEFEQAERTLDQAVERLAQVHGPEHPVTLHVISNHAQAVLGLGRHDEAIAMLSGNLEVLSRVLGERHPYTLDCRRFLVEALVIGERWDEAAEMATETLPLLQAHFGEDHGFSQEMEAHLASLAERG